jgi:hypothetical protein
MTVHLYEGAILMKICLSAMLALMLLLCASASAEEDWEDYAAFEAFDDGYDGNWVQVNALDIEFCLPEGWHETTSPEGAAYAAASDPGDATLAIRLSAENVDDLAAWGAANLKNSQPGNAGFYDVLLCGDGNAMSAYLIITQSNVLAFDFTRTSEAALSPEFALQIVGSACALWDDDVPLMDGDEDFDFGEAFEADM